MQNIILNKNDKCARTLVEGLILIYKSSVLPSKNFAINYVKKYLRDYEQSILPMLDDILSGNILFDGKQLEYKRYIFESVDSIFIWNFKDEIHNPCKLIMDIDFNLNMDDEYILNTNDRDFDSAFKNTQNKMNSVGQIYNGIISLIIEMNQEKNTFSYSGHYNPVANYITNVRTIYALEDVKERYYNIIKNTGLNNDNNKVFGFELMQLFRIYRMQKQLTLQKFILILLLIYASPEYDDLYKDFSYNLINILCELMYCGEITKIYIQDGYFNNSIPINERGSKDYTTRLSILFSMDNNDIYIARIDLPHKGEPNIHINLEEIIEDKILATGYPFEFGEIEDLNLDSDDINTLFFKFNDYYWFKSEFKAALNKSKVSREIKLKLEDLFAKQSHKEVPCSFTDAIDYMNEVKKYLQRFCLDESKLLVFDKDKIDYANIAINTRTLMEFEQHTSKNSLNCYTKDVILKTIAKCTAVNCDNYEPKSESIILDIWDMLQKI